MIQNIKTYLNNTYINTTFYGSFERVFNVCRYVALNSNNMWVCTFVLRSDDIAHYTKNEIINIIRINTIKEII